MVRRWKHRLGCLIFLLLRLHYATPQSTTAETPTSTTEGSPTPATTTVAPSLAPLLNTEGTTLATADSGTQSTSLDAEQITEEATTSGEATNDAVRARGFRFESQRNRPSANQEAEPQQETKTQKPDDKRTAWKFGRGGNNPWSSGPTPDAGFAHWTKPGSPTGSGPGVATPGSGKANEQAYIVWSTGQGNQANGWPLGANAGPWVSPGAGVPAGGWAAPPEPAEPQTGTWTTGGWNGNQPTGGEDSQSGWTDDQPGPEDDSGPQGGWDEGPQGPWDSQAGNAGGWVNGPPQGPPPNGQQGWQPQGNAGGSWAPGGQQSDEGGAPPDTPPQGGGWAPQPPAGDGQGGGWSDEDYNDGAPPPASDGSWNGRQQNGGWSNGASNDYNDGNAGWQGGDVAWKTYDEDTQTVDNIDGNLGWKVVDDGSPDSWKVVDENGNIEWKIENVNGEWKVTSADELKKANDTTPAPQTDAVNATTEATNDTAAEATTPAPKGGWDDDKQGRYIVWKFSEDGKGEAKLYDGGPEPAVWTVGGSNQWWKDATGIQPANPATQASWKSGGNGWPGKNSWQNVPQQGGNGWKSNGNSAPSAPSAGWKSGGNPSAPQQGNAKWQNGPAPQSGGNRWRGGAKNRSRWQQKGGGSGPQKTPKTRPSPPAPVSNGWKNQPSPAPAWNNGRPVSKSWRNGGQNPPPSAGQQNGWNNRGPPPSTNSSPNGGARKMKWSNNLSGPNRGQWVPKNGSGKRKNRQGSGRAWNNQNGWNTSPNGQRNRGWVKYAPSANPPDSGPPTSKPGKRGSWSGNGNGGQAVPYIIIIKSPDSAASSPAARTWRNDVVGKTTYIKSNGGGTPPQNLPQSNGYKMNKAGSSGWQMTPDGGWQWKDGWMGSGGGFGGWAGDKGAVYSSWTPKSPGGTPSTKRSSSAKDSNRSGSKMVFVFGAKRNSSSNPRVLSTGKRSKNGKQFIILDYSKGGKRAPKGESDMKKDVESVIQALRVAKPASVKRAAVFQQPIPTPRSGTSQLSRWP